MAKNFIDAIAPLTSMSKFCGYSIFSINRLDFSLTIKRNDVIFLIWIVVINCFINCFVWDSSQHYPMHKSDILSKSLPIILCGSYLFYIFTIIAWAAMRKKQSILIKSICNIDEMVRNRISWLNKVLIFFPFFSLKNSELNSTTRGKSASLFTQF